MQTRGRGATSRPNLRLRIRRYCAIMAASGSVIVRLMRHEDCNAAEILRERIPCPSCQRRKRFVRHSGQHLPLTANRDARELRMLHAQSSIPRLAALAAKREGRLHRTRYIVTKSRIAFAVRPRPCTKRRPSKLERAPARTRPPHRPIFGSKHEAEHCVYTFGHAAWQDDS